MDDWQILLSLGIFAFIVEIFTTGFIAGSVGVGFLFSAFASYFGLFIPLQILVFAIGVMLTYFLIGPAALKFGYKRHKLKTNADALIGRKGIVVQEINSKKSTGRVKIDGDNWKATANNDKTIGVGESVEIIAVKSIELIVKPLN